MSVRADEDAAAHRVPRLDFELTTGCDHRCAHCYNVWNAAGAPGAPPDAPALSPGPSAPPGAPGPDAAPGTGRPAAAYPRGLLDTEAQWAMMEKAIAESGAEQVTVTGGEPLLRRDAVELVERLCRRVAAVQVITNGSHVPAAVARRFGAAGVRSVQLTLLAADRAAHDKLKGAVCFDDTVRAALDLRDAGVPVQCCFVAVRENAGALAGVLELCLVLGIRGLSYNRMSAAGGAVDAVARLLPSLPQIEADLEVADRLAGRYGLRISTAMPIPPCLIRMSRYPRVRFGLCSVGSHSPNVVIDPLGNVRSCNLSSRILGNIRTQSWAEILSHPYLTEFPRVVPAMCRGCAYEATCQGGCKESGASTYGSLGEPEPFLRRAVEGGL